MPFFLRNPAAGVELEGVLLLRPYGGLQLSMRGTRHTQTDTHTHTRQWWFVCSLRRTVGTVPPVSWSSVRLAVSTVEGLLAV